MLSSMWGNQKPLFIFGWCVRSYNHSENYNEELSKNKNKTTV